MKKNNIFLIKLAVSVSACLLVGFIGSLATFPAIPGWYASLVKPSFSPPNFLFGPVWTILYIMMGISLALIWVRDGKGKKGQAGKKGEAIAFFIFQLILNSLWSILFFGFKSPGLALIEIVALWFSILLTMVKFFSISKTAGWLLAPYLAWVSFASILNFAIFRLN